MMTRTQASLLTVAAILTLAWLATGTGRDLPPSSAGSAHPAVRAEEESIGDAIRARSRGLRAYLSAPRPFRPVGRNPFSFSQPSLPGGGGRPARAPAAPPADTRPARPEMKLSGIAEDTGPGGPIRTAIISTLGQVVFAKEGDRILARFLVVRIAADAVQLRDGDGGELFTLAMR